MVARLYDVGDLTRNIPDFDDAPQLGVRPETTAPTSRPADAGHALNADRLVESVQMMLIDTPKAEVGLNAGNLRIVAPEEEQKRVQSAIDRWRTLRLGQISIVTRFLTVEPNAIAGLGPVMRQFIDEVLLSDRPTSIDVRQQAEILKAIQTSGKGTIVTAPRLTVFQNQRAYVLIGKPTAYVQGFSESTAKDGKVAFSPTIGMVDTGLLINLRASFDTDGSAISLDFHPQLARLDDLKTQPWAPSPAGTKAVVQVPDVTILSARQLLTVVKNHSAVIRLRDAEGKGDKTIDLVMVTPEIVNPVMP